MSLLSAGRVSRAFSLLCQVVAQYQKNALSELSIPKGRSEARYSYLRDRSTRVNMLAFAEHSLAYYLGHFGMGGGANSER